MKKYHSHQRWTRVILAILLLGIAGASCKREKPGENGETSYNLTLRMGAYSTPASAGIIPATRLFAFNRKTGDTRFSEEILNLSRTATGLSARVKAGDWNIAMIAPASASSTFLLPSGGKNMELTPLYKYVPTVDPLTGKSSNADELFNAREPVSIEVDRQTTISTRLDRNVAMIEIIINRATANFDKAATDHVIELHRVPSTISYTGALLPDRHSPDTLPDTHFLRARVKLADHPTASGYLHSDTARFIIPAHRGGDFLVANPTDTTTLKMLLRVNLQRTGGSRFIKSKEIPLVTKCNRVLRVNVNVNDGIAFITEVLPWENVDLSATVGEPYTNWLYVKRGATGNGQSWNDALPDISTAINKALVLRSHSIPLNGILVAGGSAVGAYEEAFTVPSGIKIFGGWAGTPGTELPAADSSAPYTSTRRDLAACKAIVSPPSGGINLDADSTVLDGFIIRGATGNAVPLLVNHSSAWVNAVEVLDNPVTSGYALVLTAGTGTNILVADNDGGVVLGTNATLVNATIANNASSSSFLGKLQNAVYWGNSGTPVTGSDVEYSAFDGTTPPSGLQNIAINAGNTAWFSTSETIPGPHFNLSSAPRYAVSTVTPNRSPLLGRGNGKRFDAVTAAMTVKKDIDGNPRHNENTDIGCHEGLGSAVGFQLRWDMTSIYISTKENNESEHPALLFNNTEGALVKWWVSAKSITSSRYSLVSGHVSGEGNADDLGHFKLKSAKANTENYSVFCGQVTLHSNLGDYLPDVTIDVYQTPGKSVPWTSGYVGSFHRNSEVEERVIFGSNSGAWTARIVSGVAWIKIDNHPRGYNNGIVESTFDGAVSGSGDIHFRVGMKSTLPPGEPPRYGLISISRGGGAALFFVRQGEEADYLYGPEAQGRTKKPDGRPDAIKFSPYNLTDPLGRFNADGVPLGTNGGAFVDYPSKTGYFFKFSDTRAFYPDNSINGTKLTSSYTQTWDASGNPCPPGYHVPTNPEFVESYFMNENINEAFSGGNKTTFLWGRIADGYFDKYSASGARECGTGPDRATEGLLIYNDYNNASVFFPMAGKRVTDSPGNKFFDRTGTDGGGRYVQWTMTSTEQNSNKVYVTHSFGSGTTGHIGMSCAVNDTRKSEAVSIRCVKD
ncbi:MAG: hypothetical protein LBF09_00600 [Odoribacteraceae bacterium]|jgi:hypothetical protein|nr:hypothetical protein [Odoribacteraceae bacterium]